MESAAMFLGTITILLLLWAYISQITKVSRLEKTLTDALSMNFNQATEISNKKAIIMQKDLEILKLSSTKILLSNVAGVESKIPVNTSYTKDAKMLALKIRTFHKRKECGGGRCVYYYKVPASFIESI